MEGLSTRKRGYWWLSSLDDEVGKYGKLFGFNDHLEFNFNTINLLYKLLES